VILALCLALAGGLLLAGTAPTWRLEPAMLALLPLATPAVWTRRRGRGPLLALGVAAFLLCGTSVPEMATAGAPVLSRWPPLASLPALGLALLGALLIFLLAEPPD
jgi:hypothetical protein